MQLGSDKLPIQNRLAQRDLPKLPTVMHQRWEELLFLHWTFEPQIIAKVLPPSLRVDTFDDKAWLGVVPFSMRNVRPRFLPPVSGLSNFPELNLRTYVVDEHGRPGVWFHSLDTPKRLPNWIARTFFHLNYRLARIQVEEKGSLRSYRSELWMETGWDTQQEYKWDRVGEPFIAEPGSLDFFLAERYRLFAFNKKENQLMSGQVHHEPYHLQKVNLMSYSKRLFALNGLPEPGNSPVSVLASAGVDVQISPMIRVD